MDYASVLELPPPGDCSEAFAFSIHKCGSTLLFEMIGLTCEIIGFPAISIPDRLFEVGIFEDAWGNDPEILRYIKFGYIYFGFREFPTILSGHKGVAVAKTVLLVRDPRDALVSTYFSFGGKFTSHVLPGQNKEQLLERWQATAGMSIDEYVRASAPELKRKFEAYDKNLDRNNMLLLRYEDLYLDKLSGLSDVFAHFGVEVDQAVLEKVAALNDKRPQQEDPTRHIRKATPGDYRDKLSSETIGYLNELFRPVVAPFGYVLS